MTVSTSNRILITGYVTPRQFGPFAMPVPAQNSCLREYVLNMECMYAMPQCEHIFPDCYMQLFSTLNSAPEDGHIAMYSFHMMPTSHEHLQKIFEIQIAKRLTFHFVLEKKIAASPEAIKVLRRSLYIAQVAQHNDGLRQTIKIADNMGVPL